MEPRNRINFSLVSMHEEKFEMAENIATPVESLRVQYLIETELRPGSETVYVRTGIRYELGADKICECILGIRYVIDDFDSVVSIDKDSKRINFTCDIMPTFWSITYGALRGVLFEKVKNTPLEAFPLPLLSMEELGKINQFLVLGG